MKKPLLFAPLVLIALLQVPGAAAGHGGVRFGLTGGLNFAGVTIGTINTVRYDNPVYGGLTCPAAGAFVDIGLGGGGRFSLQPELLLSRRGTDLTPGSKVRLDYLELLILPKYRLLSRPVRPFIFAGPSLSFLVGDSSDHGYKKLDCALALGGGLEFAVHGAVVSVDARYHLSASNYFPDDWGYIYVEGQDMVNSMKNRGLSLMVGIGF